MISCNSLILTLWFRAIEAWFTPGAVSGACGTVESWGTNGLTLVRVGTPVPLVTHGACFLTSQGVVTGLTSSPTNTKQTLQLLVMESTLNIQMNQCIQLMCLWYWIVKCYLRAVTGSVGTLVSRRATDAGSLVSHGVCPVLTGNLSILVGHWTSTEEKVIASLKDIFLKIGST